MLVNLFFGITLGVLLFLFMMMLFCIGEMIYLKFMLTRNEKIYNYRADLIQKDMNKYDRLPSYEVMMKKWWVFNLDDFLK